MMSPSSAHIILVVTVIVGSFDIGTYKQLHSTHKKSNPVKVLRASNLKRPPQSKSLQKTL